jgi:hypothetical protein
MTMAEDSPPPLRPQAIDHVQAFEKLQIVKVTRFAPDWLRDARSEAMLLEDIDSRRREIVFAVCFIESYLFEWVRDDVLCRNYLRSNNISISFGIATASFMAWQADQKKMTCQPTLDQYLLLSNYRVFPQDGLLRLP